MSEHDTYSLEEDLKVKPYTPVLNVFAVKADDFLKVSDVASSADLPKSCDPGQSQ